MDESQTFYVNDTKHTKKVNTFAFFYIKDKEQLKLYLGMNSYMINLYSRNVISIKTRTMVTLEGKRGSRRIWCTDNIQYPDLSGS